MTGKIHPGRRGLTGAAGAAGGAGTGVPAGGTTGQVLKKTSGTDFATEWADAGGAGVTDGDKGDITVSAAGATWTIDNDAVTYAKMQDVSATDRILGRDTAAAGNVEELTPAAVRTMLNIADGATANATDAQLRDRTTHTGVDPITALHASVPLFMVVPAGGPAVRPTNDSARLVLVLCTNTADVPLITTGTAGRYAIDWVFVKAT